MVERVQTSLLSALTDLVHWLDAANVPSMVIGGVAASVLGQPRLTQDVDALAILRPHNIAGVSVRLPRVEDLLIMKAIAHRPKDLQDMEGLLKAHPQADVTRVRQWVCELAMATGMGDLLEELDKLLARRKHR